MSKLIFTALLMVVALSVAGCQRAKNLYQKDESTTYDNQQPTGETEETMGSETDPDSLEKEVNTYQLEDVSIE